MGALPARRPATSGPTAALAALLLAGAAAGCSIVLDTSGYEDCVAPRRWNGSACELPRDAGGADASPRDAAPPDAPPADAPGTDAGVTPITVRVQGVRSVEHGAIVREPGGAYIALGGAPSIMCGEKAVQLSRIDGGVDMGLTTSCVSFCCGHMELRPHTDGANPGYRLAVGGAAGVAGASYWDFLPLAATPSSGPREQSAWGPAVLVTEGAPDMAYLAHLARPAVGLGQPALTEESTGMGETQVDDLAVGLYGGQGAGLAVTAEGSWRLFRPGDAAGGPELPELAMGKVPVEAAFASDLFGVLFDDGDALQVLFVTAGGGSGTTGIASALGEAPARIGPTGTSGELMVAYVGRDEASADPVALHVCRVTQARSDCALVYELPDGTTAFALDAFVDAKATARLGLLVGDGAAPFTSVHAVLVDAPLPSLP